MKGAAPTSSPWRPLGARGAPWPAWVRALDGRSGAYAIRQGGRVLYVGESHSGRLRSTLTRHFQGWSRRKNFWADLFRPSQQRDPGTLYDRGACEVRVWPTTAARAVELQNRLIRTLKPRDNIIGAAAEEAPF